MSGIAKRWFFWNFGNNATQRFCLSLVLVLMGQIANAADARARDLGVPFAGTTGPLNAITDVAGVEVGHVTL